MKWYCYPLAAVGWLLLYLPVVFAALYTVALITLGVLDVLNVGPGSLHAVFIAALWGYGALALVDLYVMTVFKFRHCCIGLNGLRNHITQDEGVKGNFITVLCSLIWPYNWYWYTLTMMHMWDSDWLGIVLEPTLCLIGTRRRGMRVDTIDFRNGESRTDYIK